MRKKSRTDAKRWWVIPAADGTRHAGDVRVALEEGKQDTGFGLPVSQVFALVLFVRTYSVPEARSPVHTGRTRRRSLNSVRRSSGRSQGPAAPGSWTDRRLRRQKVDECCRDGNGNKHQREWEQTPSFHPIPPFTNHLHHRHWVGKPRGLWIPYKDTLMAQYSHGTGYIQHPQVFCGTSYNHLKLLERP